MEVQSSSGSRRSGRACHAKAPGTTGDGPLQAQAFMVPAALADVAIVRVEIPSEQVLASGAQGTIRGADERKVSSIRIVDSDFAGEGSRARMLPAVTFAASMRMSDVLIAHQRLARRRPSGTASLATWNRKLDRPTSALRSQVRCPTFAARAARCAGSAAPLAASGPSRSVTDAAWLKVAPGEAILYGSKFFSKRDSSGTPRALCRLRAGHRQRLR